MVPVIDILVVDDGSGNTGEAVSAAHEIEKGFLEFLGEAIDNAIGALAEDLHLALVGLAHAVAFESVLVAALLLTHLAVPSQLLQTLRLDPIRDRLRSQELVLPHRSSVSLSLSLETPGAVRLPSLSLWSARWKAESI